MFFKVYFVSENSHISLKDHLTPLTFYLNENATSQGNGRTFVFEVIQDHLGQQLVSLYSKSKSNGLCEWSMDIATQHDFPNFALILVIMTQIVVTPRILC